MIEPLTKIERDLPLKRMKYVGPCMCGEDHCPNTRFYNTPCFIIDTFGSEEIVILRVKLIDEREILCYPEHVEEI